MKLGVQGNAWKKQWEDDFSAVIKHVGNLNFDFIEIVLTSLYEINIPLMQKQIKDSNLEVCTSAILPEYYDITSNYSSVRRNGIDFLKSCVLTSKELGASLFSGIIYAKHFKQPENRNQKDLWKYAAEGLHEVALYAKKLGVTIGIEPVNRYETCLINTYEQALTLKNIIGEPNVKIHLDTFHMNIEEKSIYETIKRAKDNLCHLHLNENDFGIVGTGQVDFYSLIKALKEIDYKGYASFESVIDIEGDYVWRKLAASSEDLIIEGKEYVEEVIRNVT